MILCMKVNKRLSGYIYENNKVTHEHLQYKIVTSAFPTYKEKMFVHLTIDNSQTIALGENLRRKSLYCLYLRGKNEREARWTKKLRKTANVSWVSPGEACVLQWTAID